MPATSVHTGQVLAELDREEIQAQVNSARAQLLSAEANLKGAEADLTRAKVDAEGVDIPTLQRAYERAQQMAKDGVVSASALDDAQRAYELAVNKRDVARAQYTVNKAKVAQAEADVQKNRATLNQLEEQLELYDHHLADRRRGAVARCGDRRRCQLHSGAGFGRNAGHDAGRYQ